MQDPSFAAGLAHNENLAELTMTIRPQASIRKVLSVGRNRPLCTVQLSCEGTESKNN